MGRPVHFEIHADDPERAVRFYEAAFGWRFQRFGEEPYWLAATGEGPGIDGAVLPRSGPQPTDETPFAAFVVTIDVADLDASIHAVEAGGGRVTVGRQPIPGVGWLAYARDTEGNQFGMMQPDPKAGQAL